jgi:hypothetical protein
MSFPRDFSVPLTNEECSLVYRAASLAGCAPSDWMRHVCLTIAAHVLDSDPALISNPPAATIRVWRGKIYPRV